MICVHESFTFGEPAQAVEVTEEQRRVRQEVGSLLPKRE